jgi:hypothetical protein
VFDLAQISAVQVIPPERRLRQASPAGPGEARLYEVSSLVQWPEREFRSLHELIASGSDDPVFEYTAQVVERRRVHDGHVAVDRLRFRLADRRR